MFSEQGQGENKQMFVVNIYIYIYIYIYSVVSLNTYLSHSIPTCKNLKIYSYKTLVPLLLYDCETYSLALKEESF